MAQNLVASDRLARPLRLDEKQALADETPPVELSPGAAGGRSAVAALAALGAERESLLAFLAA